jgi:archaellum component FlaC
MDDIENKLSEIEDSIDFGVKKLIKEFDSSFAQIDTKLNDITSTLRQLSREISEIKSKTR